MVRTFFSLTKSKIQGSYFYVKKKDLSWVTAVCSELLDFLESSNLTSFASPCH